MTNNVKVGEAALELGKEEALQKAGQVLVELFPNQDFSSFLAYAKELCGLGATFEDAFEDEVPS